MQSVREGLGPQSMCIGRVDGGANTSPFVDLPPQARRVTVGEENTASGSAAAFSLVFMSMTQFVYHLNTLVCASMTHGWIWRKGI